MRTIAASPIEHAITLAAGGARVLWLDSEESTNDTLDYLKTPRLKEAYEQVRAITGSRARRQIAVDGGGLIYFRTSARAVRGMTADVLFCAEKFRTPEALDEISPALETKGLQANTSLAEAGLVYQLFEQVI